MSTGKKFVRPCEKFDKTPLPEIKYCLVKLVMNKCQTMALKMILSGEYDINCKADGRDAFEVAVCDNNKEIVSELLKRHPMHKLCDGSIIFAIIDKMENSFVCDILRNWEDFTVVNIYKRTIPMELARKGGYSEFLNELMDAGKIDFSAINDNGNTFLYHLLDESYDDLDARKLIIRVIKTGDRNIFGFKTANDFFSRLNDLKDVAVKMIKSGRLEPNYRDEDGSLPLSYAIMWKDMDSIAELAKITNCSQEFKHGISFLDWAQTKKYPSAIIQDMLNGIADPKILLKFLISSPTAYSNPRMSSTKNCIDDI